jgi:seryl-tRNA synthetase
MWTTERVVRGLRGRGELWEALPGAIGLRGPVLGLQRALERTLREIALRETRDEWQTPAAIGLDTLARADYFASFPQWLTAASHLSGDPADLERVARSPQPAAEAGASLAPASGALPPAICYHTYAALAGTHLDAPRVMTAQGTCWRHEGDRLTPLERGWAFTMREVVCLAHGAEVEAFRARGLEAARALAEALGLEAGVEIATDPFFAPTSRGKALFQRAKALKHELVLPIGGGRTLAAASFNHHDTFFGDAFAIRLADGSPAASGCVAFGIERWLLAFLCAHGVDPASWPELPICHETPS